MEQNQLSQHRAGSLRRLVFSACLVPALAFANPTGGVLTNGTVNFVGTGTNNLQITQSTQRAIINWTDFSIAPGELTNFNLPNSSAATLNRVSGLNPTSIHGMLRSNGSIILLNPNGILIGVNGMVDTGASFIASTLDISDANFLAGGDLPLLGASQASVINLGAISAFDGDVFLIAASVENQGNISAPNGTVGLAAGNDVLIRESGEERVWVRGASGAVKAEGVVNTGTIDANIAELKSFGGNIYGMAVKNEGRVAATGVTTSGGQIFLSAGAGSSKIRNTGQLFAEKTTTTSGGKISIQNSGNGSQVEVGGTVEARSNEPGGVGGDVLILGAQIDILPSSVILVDGPNGGGHVMFGGDVSFSGIGQIDASELTLFSPVNNSANFDFSGGDVFIDMLSVTSPIGSLDLNNQSGDLSLGAIQAQGDIVISTAGSLNASGTLQSGNNITLKAMTLNLNHAVVADGVITTGPFSGGEVYLGDEIEIFDAPPSGHTLNANGGLVAPLIFVNGSDDNDIFNINGGLGDRNNGVVAEVFGELGFDTLNINSIDLEATRLTSIESVRGMGGSSRIIGKDSNEVYSFADSNIVVTGGQDFEGFQFLDSGTGSDLFQLGVGLLAAPYVDDKGGVDTLITAAGFNDLVEMDEINEATVNSVFQIGGIEIIDTNTGDDLFLLDLGTATQQVIGGSGFDRIHTTGLFLIGESTLSGIEEIRGIGTSDLLTIDELDTGIPAGPGEMFTLAADGSIAHDGVSYLDFERLWGGSQDDNFNVESGFMRDIEIQGRGGIDTLAASSGADRFVVTSENGGTLNDRVKFATVEKLAGGAENDLFTFENQATVQSVDGGVGTDMLSIDDRSLGGTNTYTVTDGLVSRNPQYRFSSVESIQLLLGSGNDTVDARGSGINLDLDGGGGFDSLLTANSDLLDGNPITNGDSTITYQGFEAPLGILIIDLGDLLTLELGENQEGVPVFELGDESGNGTFLVENNFNENGESGGFNLLGLSEGGAGLFGVAPAAAAALANLGQAVVITVDGGQFLLDAPASLDGTFSQPSFEVIAALRENLNPVANGELASALEFFGGALLINQDGAIAMDLSGPPPPALLQLLQENLGIGAAQELAGALGIVVALPLTNIDGPAVIGLIIIQPGQETIQALIDHLGAAAEAELEGALGN